MITQFQNDETMQYATRSLYRTMENFVVYRIYLPDQEIVNESVLQPKIK
jgi:hypothetical protein